MALQRNFLLILITCSILSCSTKKQLLYLNNSNSYLNTEIQFDQYKIQPFDIIKIDVHSSNVEAAIPYNRFGSINNRNINPNLDNLQLDGYLVDEDFSINFPVLGKIILRDKTLTEIEKTISDLLLQNNHLADPVVNSRIINAKFTVLGEVLNPGTFSFIGERLTLLQAIGFAGDLTIDGKRTDIILIREINNIRKIKKINLTDTSTLNLETYFIRPNDVIIIQPNFNKVKSAGFIGNPSSIASIAQIILSIALIIVNR